MYQLKPNDGTGMDEEESGMYDPTEEDGEEEGAVSGELTESQKKNIKELYVLFDIDKSGSLSFQELRKALQVLGLNPTISDVKNLMKKHNVETSNKTGRKITYEVWEQILKEELLSKTNNEFDLLEAFRIFDKDKNGTLDRDELKRCLTSLGEQLTDKEVDELFDQLDTDKSGTLSVMEASKLLA